MTQVTYILMDRAEEFRTLVSTPGSQGWVHNHQLPTQPSTSLHWSLALPSCPTVVKTGGTQRVCALEQVCPKLWGFVRRPLVSGNLGDHAEGMDADGL